MKNRIVLLGFAVAVLMSSCSKENESVAPEQQWTASEAVWYRFSAQAADPMTKAFFKEDEAPSRFIYWENEDVFDFHDFTKTDDGVSVSVSSGAASEVGEDSKSVVFEQQAHDWFVISYPKGLVSVDEDNESVIASVPGTQKLSSVLNPSYVPMVSEKLALSEAAKAAVADESDKVSVAYDGAPVSMYPLAGLVNIHIKALPGVTAGTITKAVIRTDVTYKTGDPQVGVRGDSKFSLAAGNEFLSTFVAGDNNVRNSLLLEDGQVTYTEADGANISFVAAHSAVGLKTLQISLYLSDGTIVKKSFNASSNLIGLSKARVSNLTLDFTSGSIVKDSETGFSVEWSQGYLVYDAANKAYAFGGPSDIGLYFKYGSPVGYQFYADTEDYDKRIHPVDADGKFLSGSSTFMEGGQTVANGTDFFYSGQTMGSGASMYKFYGDNTTWKDKTYYYPESGQIVSGTLHSETEYYAMEGTLEFSGANDPCSYVKVAEGEKAWRVPTLAEVNELISVGAAGLEFGNFDGSDMKNNDGKSRYLRYTDGEQTFYLKGTGSINTTYLSNYSAVQNTYSGKYAPRFWAGDSYTGETTTPPTKTANGAKAFNISASSPFGLTSAPAVAAYAANRYHNYSLQSKRNAASVSAWEGDYYLWEAVAVRCVRDK